VIIIFFILNFSQSALSFSIRTLKRFNETSFLRSLLFFFPLRDSDFFIFADDYSLEEAFLKSKQSDNEKIQSRFRQIKNSFHTVV
jgi:hypothetical protein